MRANSLAACLLAACAAGASSYQPCEQPGGGTGQCLVSGDPGTAAGHAVIAGGAWAVAGCRINGCEPPLVCNEKNGLCEQAPCGEGIGCPAGTSCNLSKFVCE